MADDHIQRPPQTPGPATTPAGGEQIAPSPRPAPAGPAGRPGAAPGGQGALGAWVGRNARFVGVGVLVGAVAAVALKAGLDIGVGQVAGLAVIVGLAAGLAAHSWLGLGPVKPQTAGQAETRSEVSNTREIIETVVFVVVLVLMLKSFVAEAFVIPTGSMATTLWGYQKIVTCPKCGYEFPVNCSQEVDPQDGARPEVVRSCTCPNCRFTIPMAERKKVERRDQEGRRMESVEWVPLPQYSSNTGDRVLVGKFLYDLPWNSPDKHRLNVVVFKYPVEPQKKYTPMNYIKRLIGLPGETIAIYYGKLYVLPPEAGLRFDDSGVPPLERWRYENMHVSDPQAIDRFKRGEFHILRKPPEVLLAQRRIVYDADHPVQVPDFLKALVPARWSAADGSGWVSPPDRPTVFEARPGGAGAVSWLRYRNVTFWKTYCTLLVRNSPPLRQWARERFLHDQDRPDIVGDPSEADLVAALEHHYLELQTGDKNDSLREAERDLVSANGKRWAESSEFRRELITDFMGYNSFEPPSGPPPVPHWVGDLTVECDVKVDKPEGRFVLELSRGTDRFRAAFDLASGDCTLRRVKDYIKDEAPADDAGEVLATKPTDLKKPGTYHVRFANVDQRLLVWVDRSLPFGAEGQAYDPPHEPGPYPNDLQPASVGVRGAAVSVSKLQLWRDTYYTKMGRNGDVYPQGVDYSDPHQWDALRGGTDMDPMTLYVQPGHYLCLGDNSPHSSDGRAWGLVPERLMLGRALVVYYPFWPLGEQRIGPIH
jgi:signal peptidase I